MGRGRGRSACAKPALGAAPVCQVAGCEIDLRSEQKPAYCIKRRLCQLHIKADTVQRDGDDGALYRFCFQCGKLEPLARFKGQQRSCLASLELRRTATITHDRTPNQAGGDDTMSDAARPRADAGAAAACGAGSRATRVRLPRDGGAALPAAAPASGDADTARVDQCASLGGAPAAAQAAQHPLGGALLLRAGPPSSSQMVQGAPEDAGAAAAMAELAVAFCCNNHGASQALGEAAEAAYIDVAAGLCAALVGPAPPAAAVPSSEHVSGNAEYERLLEQLLAEMQLPWPAAQRADSSATAGASSVSGDESRCTLLAQHRAWAHDDDAPAQPAAITGAVAQHEAGRHGLLPAAPASRAAGALAGARLPPGAAAAPEAAASAELQLAAQAARMQCLQRRYDELEGVLALVNSVSTSVVPLLL